VLVAADRELQQRVGSRRGASRPEPTSRAVINEEGRGDCDDGHQYVDVRAWLGRPARLHLLRRFGSDGRFRPTSFELPVRADGQRWLSLEFPVLDSFARPLTHAGWDD
jgi:hypothetical protein